jgi:hypothetical protein
MAEKNIVCVHCSVCVHPLPDCCRFYGNQLSCIDCYRRRHVIFVPHAIRDGDSSQLLAKKGTASTDVKTPPESNEKARLGEGKKNVDKNDKVAKKDGSAQDLKAAHQSNDAAKKEDDRKPVAVAKKMDDTTLKMKDPPTKRADEEDQTDNKKPAAKENVQDKKKRRNAKLPLYPNSTRPFAEIDRQEPKHGSGPRRHIIRIRRRDFGGQTKTVEIDNNTKGKRNSQFKADRKRPAKKRVQGEVNSG